VSGDIGPLMDAGLADVVALVSGSITTQQAMVDAPRLLESAAAEAVRRRLTKRADA